MPLFEHQQLGVEWMKKRENIIDKDEFAIRGGILADEMGLGKTIQMTTLISENPVSRTLLIVPKVTLEDWKKTLEGKDLKYVVYPDIITSDVKVQIFTIGFLSRRNPAVSIGLSEWNRVIVDEGHFLLNKGSQKSVNLQFLNSQYWWIMSATPINLTNSFQNYFRLFGDVNYKTRTLEEFHELVLVRKICEITELKSKFPEKNVEIKYIIPEGGEIDHYSKFTERTGKYGMKFLEKSIRQMQGTVDPNKPTKEMFKKYNNDDDNVELGCSKLNFAKYRAIMSDFLKEPERPTIIFCRYKFEMSDLKDMFAQNNIPVDFIDGKNKEILSTLQDLKNNEDNVKVKPNTVLLCQASVASVGINLQYYNRVMLTMPMWTVFQQNQAIARAYRYGQQKDVDVKIYCIKNTIDDYFLERHKKMNAIWK
tara:strand:+ start:452 stop:1717 length:1266 start_codon:yes stop_codon:yes gene_type:complete